MTSGTTANLNGVWGSSGSDVFAVGDGDNTVLHYDGSSWTSTKLEHYCHCEDLFAVWGSSENNVFALGGFNSFFHYDGNSWNCTQIYGNYGYAGGIWGSSGSDVFAVNEYDYMHNGAVSHYDGTTWSPMTTPEFDLSAVWGSSSIDVFAVGYNYSDEEKAILHYDGSNWTSIQSGGARSLSGIWGSSGTDIFSVGDGTIIHYSGKSWSPMESGAAERLNDVWGSSSTDVFAVGNNGTIIHYDGPIPPTVSTTESSSITSSSADSGGNVTSDGGAAVTARGVCWNTSVNPTTSDQTIPAGSNVGSFSCAITGLAEDTTYYIRAYAINSADTAYGENRSFKTLTTAGCPDCTGADPIVNDFTFKAGTDCKCTGTNSMTIGPNVEVAGNARVVFESGGNIVVERNVIVQRDARAILKSDNIVLKSTVEAHEGSEVKIGR